MDTKVGKDLWSRDEVQFPRLLAEIRAVGLTSNQKRGIAESMDVTVEQLDELFRRADLAFMRIKARFLNEGKSRCANCSQAWLDADLEEARGLSQRTEPGGTVPSGECPECGALCYPIRRRKKR